MKQSLLTIFVSILFSPLLAASCATPEAGTRVWDIAADALQKICTIESEVDALSSIINNGFSGTFTAYDQLLQKVCNAEADAISINSSFDRLESQLPAIISMLNTAESNIELLTSKVAEVNVNPSDLFTALHNMSETVCSKIEVVITGLNGIELQILDITAAEIAFTQTILSKVDGLNIKSNLLNSAIDAIGIGSAINVLDSNVDMFVSLVDNLESDVTHLNDTIVSGFSGTFTALQRQNIKAMDLASLSDIVIPEITADFSEVFTVLDELAATVCDIESLVDIITLVNINNQLNSIDSKIDVGLACICVAESKIAPLPSLADVINSKLGYIADTSLPELNSDVDSALSKMGPINSKTNDISSRIMVINPIDGTNGLLTINSELDEINSKLSLITPSSSKIMYIDSKIDTEIQQAFTIESLVDVMQGEVETISSKIDKLGLQSEADVINSKAGVIIPQFITINSNLDVLNATLLTVDSKLNYIIPVTESNLSALTTIESKINIVDSKVSRIHISSLDNILDLILQQACTAESKLMVLDNQLALDNAKADHLIADMNGTWTALATIDTKLNNAQTSLIRASSKISTINIARDISATYTVIAALQAKENTVNSKIDATTSLVDRFIALQPDLSGTFTVLNSLSNTINSVGSKVDVINSEIDVLVDYCGFPIYNSTVGTTGFTITTPGRYFLAENIIFSPGVINRNAITINTSNVYLDLNGRTIQQGDATASTDGIQTGNNLSNIVIANGVVRNLTGIGINIGTSVSNVICRDVITLNTGSNGINFGNDSSNSLLRNVTVSGAGAVGAIVSRSRNCVIRDSAFNNNASSGCTITASGGVSNINTFIINSYASNNTLAGISVPAVAGNLAVNILLQGCTAENNASAGLSLNLNVGATVIGCRSVQNVNGLSFAGTATAVCMDNICIDNSTNNYVWTGTAGNQLQNNYVAFNTGIQSGSTNFSETISGGVNTYLGNFAFKQAGANYNMVNSNLTSKIATIAQTGAFPSFTPTKWMNINMTP